MYTVVNNLNIYFVYIYIYINMSCVVLSLFSFSLSKTYFFLLFYHILHYCMFRMDNIFTVYINIFFLCPTFAIFISDAVVFPCYYKVVEVKGYYKKNDAQTTGKEGRRKKKKIKEENELEKIRFCIYSVYFKKKMYIYC